MYQTIQYIRVNCVGQDNTEIRNVLISIPFSQENRKYNRRPIMKNCISVKLVKYKMD